MTLNELLPLLHELQRADKLRAVQFLVLELAEEEGVKLVETDANLPLWTPYGAYEAADVMLKVLAEDSASYG